MKRYENYNGMIRYFGICNALWKLLMFIMPLKELLC